MIELVEEKIDGNTIKVWKRDSTLFKKKDLEDMKIRMQAELTKVNNLLGKF